VIRASDSVSSQSSSRESLLSTFPRPDYDFDGVNWANDPMGRQAMPSTTETSGLSSAAIFIARLIFAAVFAMAATFKFLNISGTADYITAAGFPFASGLAWIAAVFEVILVLCLLTGAYFSEAAIAAAIYVVFLGFAFHGPNHWAASQAEFGFFIDHFTFLAGLMFAACHGPGNLLTLNRQLWRP
jgi:putative oxidoreductase